MTYSIVARDGDTGELGVAVQSCMFAAGAVVPCARAGVGAVATQAFAEAAYGPWCLDAVQAGASASSALDAARERDPLPVLRQVGLVAADGRTAAFTGELCVDHAGHVTGDGYSVQANIMASPYVWPAMADAFASSHGPLARRLLAALEAGEAAGGDARGRMSAAILVVAGEAPELPAGGTVTNLRVDHSDDPLGELAALLDAADAYAGFHRGVDQLAGGDPAGALGTVNRALELLPGDRNLRFLHAGALFGTGSDDAGGRELHALVAEAPSWELVVRGFAAKGLVALPDGVTVDDLLD
jgi:uncharacterized Ntn-hydrolase superfamily protein